MPGRRKRGTHTALSARLAKLIRDRHEESGLSYRDLSAMSRQSYSHVRDCIGVVYAGTSVGALEDAARLLACEWRVQLVPVGTPMPKEPAAVADLNRLAALVADMLNARVTLRTAATAFTPKEERRAE